MPPTACAPTDAHLRVAVGLDYLSAAPVRGSRIGGEGEGLDVRIRVDQPHAASGRNKPLDTSPLADIALLQRGRNGDNAAPRPVAAIHMKVRTR